VDNATEEIKLMSDEVASSAEKLTELAQSLQMMIEDI
jgi:methyl-accepting chemotaxis protein